MKLKSRIHGLVDLCTTLSSDWEIDRVFIVHSCSGEIMRKQLLNMALVTGTVAVTSLGTFVGTSEAATLGGYTFEPPPNPGSLSPSGVVSGVTFSDFSYVGSGNTNFPAGQNPPGKAYSANGFSDDGIISINNSADDGYFTFSITPNAGQTVNLTGFQFATKPNGNDAPANVLVRSSLDGFASNLFSTSITKNDWESWSFGLAQTLTGAVSFRIYGFNSGPGKADNLDIDNVFLDGSVATTPIPTPALLPGAIGMGIAALRKKKREQGLEEATQEA